MEAFLSVRSWVGFIDETITKRITTMNGKMMMCGIIKASC